MRWRWVSDADQIYCQYLGKLGVYGTIITAEDNKPLWSARVMPDCRLPDGAGPPISGKALTLDGAKRVVELLCEVTGTSDKKI